MRAAPDRDRARRPIRVLVVISNLEFGGAQRQVVELTNNADPSLLSLHVCSLSDYVPLAEFLDDAGRRLHVIPKRHKYDYSVVGRLEALLRDLQSDIVHSFLFDADIAARLAGRRAGAIVIGSERNTDYHLKLRQRLAYRLTYGQVDRIVANSTAGARFNGRVLGYGESMYRVVHNGVDTRRFAPGDGAGVRAELGIGEDEKVVGMFASFKEQKNHPMFYAAARRIVEVVPRTRLLLVGDMLYAGMHGSDRYQERMDALVDEYGLRKNCLFLGNRSDVDRIYRACDVTVLPSLFEGTPNVLLESMSSGVPVVATDVSDNAIVVADGETGYLVSLGDEAAMADRILGILGDDALRKRMSLRSREWIEAGFSLRKLVDKMHAVYDEAMAARDPGWPGPAPEAPRATVGSR